MKKFILISTVSMAITGCTVARIMAPTLLSGGVASYLTLQDEENIELTLNESLDDTLGVTPANTESTSEPDPQVAETETIPEPAPEVDETETTPEPAPEVAKKQDLERTMAWCSGNKDRNQNTEEVQCGDKNKIVVTVKSSAETEKKEQPNSKWLACRSSKTEVIIPPNGDLKTETQTVCKGQDGKWHGV
ncbi:hypothetical protein TI05_18965 [Achromatium sp. WMS3]|nr:hypothetical protein TI05_18965 [Achromatium sp. WMS3]